MQLATYVRHFTPMMRPPMGYLGAGRLGVKRVGDGRIVQKILGDGRLTFSKWEQGAPFFHSKNIF